MHTLSSRSGRWRGPSLWTVGIESHSGTDQKQHESLSRIGTGTGTSHVTQLLGTGTLMHVLCPVPRWYLIEDGTGGPVALNPNVNPPNRYRFNRSASVTEIPR